MGIVLWCGKQGSKTVAPVLALDDGGSMTSEFARSSRQAWIDRSRGLGVILVVFGHVLGGLVRANMFPAGMPASMMDFTLYTFHMPLFFFLAGLNVEHSLARGAKRFLSEKLWTIAYPYVLWSLIQGGIAMMFSADANSPVYPADLAAIWYRPIAQFWFLYALMICHTLIVLVPQRLLLAVLSAAGFVVFEFLPVRPDMSLTLHHLPLYLLGIALADPLRVWTPTFVKGWIAVAVAAICFAGAVMLGWSLAPGDSFAVAAIPACLLGIVLVVLFCKLAASSPFAWLAYVGRLSMTIYVLHILVTSAVRLIIVRWHLPPAPVLYLLAMTASGVIVPILLGHVLAKLGWLGPLGLAPLQDRVLKAA